MAKLNQYFFKQLWKFCEVVPLSITVGARPVLLKNLVKTSMVLSEENCQQSIKTRTNVF